MSELRHFRRLLAAFVSAEPKLNIQVITVDAAEEGAAWDAPAPTGTT